MRYAYVDESIHDRGDFIVVAVIFSDSSLDAEVHQILGRHGLSPPKDEFKSSMDMMGNPTAQLIRDEIGYLIIEHCKLAFAICPVRERNNIMSLVGRLIASMERDQQIEPTILHFDEGIKSEEIELPEGWDLQQRCDSKQIAGIQVADHAAHTVATLILSAIGLVNKIVQTHGAYPEPIVELDWKLWASVRYAMSSNRPVGGYDEDGLCEPMMHPFGLFISDGCSGDLKVIVQERLGNIWVGCIH